MHGLSQRESKYPEYTDSFLKQWNKKMKPSEEDAGTMDTENKCKLPFITEKDYPPFS